MIDYEKLDALMELPVPEEMLGAYVEGNLHGSELREVQNIIGQDSFVADLISNAEDFAQINNDLSDMWMSGQELGIQEDFGCQSINADDFTLPEIVLDMSAISTETTLIQDTTLAHLQGGHEEDTSNLGVSDNDSSSCGLGEVNSEF